MKSKFILNIDEKIKDILSKNISDVTFETGFSKRNTYQNKKTPIVIVYVNSAFSKRYYLDINNDKTISRPKKVQISIGFIIYVDKNDKSSKCMDIFDSIYDVLSSETNYCFQEFSCSDINFDNTNNLFFLNAQGKIQDIVYKI